jgi:hypothetical protein
VFFRRPRAAQPLWRQLIEDTCCTIRERSLPTGTAHFSDGSAGARVLQGGGQSRQPLAFSGTRLVKSFSCASLNEIEPRDQYVEFSEIIGACHSSWTSR